MSLKKEGEILFEIIEESLRVTKKEILSRSRKRHIIDAKRIIVFILKKKNEKYRHQEIGDIIGISHCTITHYINTHENIYLSDSNFRNKFDSISSMFETIVERQFPVEQNIKLLSIERDRINKEIIRLLRVKRFQEKESWTWPLPGVDCEIPIGTHQGAFGAIRKHDIHTGVDLYCNRGQSVVAMEDGRVISIENFTGPHAGTPWWKNTKAVLVKGSSGIIVYGEISPVDKIKVGDKVRAGKKIGKVLRVLRKNKGLPMYMLHLELYSSNIKETVVWNHNSEKPEFLINPTEIIQKAKQNS